MTFARRVIIAAAVVAALLTVCHILQFSPQPASLLGDRMQQGFPRWAKNRDGVFTMDTNPLDHSLWRQDTQAPFLPHLSIYTGRGVDRKSPSLENVRLLLRIPKTFRAKPWTGGYFVSDLEGPQMRFLYRTGNSVLVIPPMSHAVGSVSDEAATFLTGFLKRPSNAIMVLGSFQGVFFINENIALEDGSALSLKAVPATGPFELQDNVVGTMWERAPMALPCPDDKGCVGVALESLPQQAIVLYASLHSASVFAIPLGNGGIILFVGFDFDSSFSEVPPAWARVLEVAKRYITQMTSSTPRIHSPGYTAYLNQKAADARRAASARTRYANFLKRANVPVAPSVIPPVLKKQKAKALAKKQKVKVISQKQKHEVVRKQIKHEERKEARRQFKKELQAAEAARKASRERARRELKEAQKEAARQASLKKKRAKELEIAARKAAREQAKVEEKRREVEANRKKEKEIAARKAAREQAKVQEKRREVEANRKKEKDKLNLQRKVAPHTKSGQHAASAKPLAKPKKAKSSSASASSASKSSTAKASTAKASTAKASTAKASTAKASTAKAHSAAEIDSHVELGQIRARFSQLHSQAYHYRELATSHFSHVSTSLAQGDRLSAASWIELFDAAVSKAHEASSAATALSKKIVRHAVGVVTKRRESYLVARKARRIALHELTKARALLSRGFYDRKMGYPVRNSFSAALVLLLCCSSLTPH
jgi:hypothetical protein